MQSEAQTPAGEDAYLGEMTAGKWQTKAYDVVAIMLIWAASWFIAVFVEPNYDEFTTAELTYSTLYNVGAGALVGFYLFDRLPHYGPLGFTARAAAVILTGTMLNESLVEPLAFGDGPINGEGVYHGLLDTLILASLFLLVRLVGRVATLQKLARAALDRVRTNSTRDKAACFIVRVASENRKIYAWDVLYLVAERDFARIVCANGEHFVSESLKRLMEKVEHLGIVRVHKSFAVSLWRVDRIARGEAHIGEHTIPIGRRYWQAFVNRWEAEANNPPLIHR